MEKQNISLEEYRKQAFKVYRAVFITLVLAEGFSLSVFALCMLAICDKSYMLPSFIVFCVSNIGIVAALIFYVKKVQGFKHLNPDLKD